MPVTTLSHPTATPADVPHLRPLVLLGIGLVGGFASGLLGIGGGTVMVPLLVLAAGVGQRFAHALSLAAIIPISIVGVTVFAVSGEVRLPEAAALAVGAIVGARIGAGMLADIDERLLKRVFGLFLVAVAVVMAVSA
jgi:uncharacterized membrane protein YfcA